ncbi:apolipoprotein N-acyltransferase [Roseococcus sp. YIM B11640]|uniref:apolipoprotein N-acyltransferase n=1 Tax=Roseococcus sp. YIM B11640 TaxID=3133973 RepID=UPI003C7AE213
MSLHSVFERLAARPWLAAFVFGAASALALPPVYALPVLLLTIPGLLTLLGRAKGWRQAAWIGAWFGFGHQLVGLYWVTHAILTDVAKWFWLVPLAAPGLALPMGLYSILPALVAWRLAPGWPRVLGFAGAWVLAELLRGWAFTGFPWNLMGTAWAFAPLPMQPAALIGAFGLSFFTILLAGLPLLGARRAFGTGGAILAVWMGYGAWRLQGLPPQGTGAQLVLVQGNVRQDLKWDPSHRAAIFQRYVALTSQGAAAAVAEHPEAPVLVVWPETASPFLLAQDPEAIRIATEALPPRGLLLAGTVRAEWGPDGRANALANSLVVLDADGQRHGLYDKSYLVPFGEFMPFGGLLPIRLAAGGMDFSAGPGPSTLPLPGGLPAPGPLICYEVIFPGEVVGAERPGWLLNVTNDAWFGNSAGPYQHLASARMRAVEEGLPMVRAAQTGISAVFDRAGREVARLGLGETGVLRAELPAAGPPTLFGRWGRWIPGGILILSLAVALLLGWRRPSQV